eukprot:1143920-Karenia_brevis.AAC.1
MSSEEWQCGDCTYVNAAGVLVCEMCGQPAPGSWACARCTYQNIGQVCAMCEAQVIAQDKCGLSTPKRRLSNPSSLSPPKVSRNSHPAVNLDANSSAARASSSHTVPELAVQCALADLEDHYCTNTGAPEVPIQLERVLMFAQKSIWLSLYFLNNARHTKVLVDLVKQRRVQIRLIVDEGQFLSPIRKDMYGCLADILAADETCAKVRTRRHSSGQFSIMHQKSVIVDEMVLLTGSYNWSNQATRNDEDLATITNESSVHEAIKCFKVRWEGGRKRSLRDVAYTACYGCFATEHEIRARFVRSWWLFCKGDDT